MKSILHQQVSHLELYKYLSYQETRLLRGIIFQQINLLPVTELQQPHYDRPIMKMIWVAMDSHYMKMRVNITEPNNPEISGDVTFFYTKDDFLLSRDLYLIQAGYRLYN
jgi:hypothetical protein